MPVTFVLVNEDPIDHEWIIGDAAFHERHRTGTEAHHGARPNEMSIPALETVRTTITFDEPGTLQYICHLPGHEAYGMVGTLTDQLPVRPDQAGSAGPPAGGQHVAEEVAGDAGERTEARISSPERNQADASIGSSRRRSRTGRGAGDHRGPDRDLDREERYGMTGTIAPRPKLAPITSAPWSGLPSACSTGQPELLLDHRLEQHVGMLRRCSRHRCGRRRGGRPSSSNM